MVRHYVKELTHAPLPQGRCEGPVVDLGTEGKVELVVVGDIVAMGIVRARSKKWREITVAYP